MACHEHFKASRKYGEWFTVSPEEAIKYISGIKLKEDELSRMYLDGCHISAIAEKFNVSRQAILKKLEAYGLRKAEPIVNDVSKTKNKVFYETKALQNDNIDIDIPKNEGISINISSSNYERVGKNRYKHRKSGEIFHVEYKNNKFVVVN